MTPARGWGIAPYRRIPTPLRRPHGVTPREHQKSHYNLTIGSRLNQQSWRLRALTLMPHISRVLAGAIYRGALCYCGSSADAVARFDRVGFRYVHARARVLRRLLPLGWDVDT